MYKNIKTIKYLIVNAKQNLMLEIQGLYGIKLEKIHYKMDEHPERYQTFVKAKNMQCRILRIYSQNCSFTDTYLLLTQI